MFIDTNVFVGSRFPNASDHDVATARLERAIQSDESLTISRQVVREYLAVVTRPQGWRTALTQEQALDDAERLLEGFEILEDGPVVTQTMIALCREVVVGGRQIHDANIVATMLAHGERKTANIPTRGTSDASLTT